MRHSFHRLAMPGIPALFLTFVAVAASSALPSQVRITGTLVRVDLSSVEEASVFLQTSGGELQIAVHSRASVFDADGQPRDILALDAGQEVELRGNFLRSSMVVDEVRILHADPRETLRSGNIRQLRQEGGVTTFQLDGVPVYASSYVTSVLGDRSAEGLPQFQEGQQVRVRGNLSQDRLVALSIAPSDPTQRSTVFEVEGHIEAGDSKIFDLALGGSGQRIQVSGGSPDSILPAPGTAVKVTGDIGADNRLHATAINMPPGQARKSIQLKLNPTFLHLKPGETGTLELSIKPRQSVELEVSLSSMVPAIATVPAKVTIPKETGSVPVSVKAGMETGLTLIIATPPSGTGAYRTGAIVAVEEKLPWQRPKADFQPDELKLKVNSQGELMLHLTPAPAADVTFTLTSGDKDLFACDATATVPAGKTSTKVKVTSLAKVGKALLTATATVKSASAQEADVAVAAKAMVEVVEDPAARRPEAEFRPDELKLKVNSQGELMLHLTPAPAADVTFTLTSGNKDLFTCDATATVPAGKTSTKVKVTSLAKVGKALLTATATVKSASAQEADVAVAAKAMIEVVPAGPSSVSPNPLP